MTVSAKVSGTFQTVTAISAKVSGAWQPVTHVYARVAGVWQEVFGVVQAITVDADWGVDGPFPPPGTCESAVRTLTVPAGNPGLINFSFLSFTGGSLRYSINGGAFVPVGLSAVAVANGDTLQFQESNFTNPDTGSGVEVHDTLDDSLVGQWSMSVGS